MKNKRQESKDQTLSRIIEATKQLINKRGIILLNTMDIAKSADIAHGTVFSHFASKEILISFICQSELKRIALNLKELSDDGMDSINIVLDNYLNLMAADEDFFVVLAKEFPFLSTELQQSIISTESIIRNVLYKNIEKGIQNGIYKNVDITMSISFLIGTMNYYLSRKAYFVESDHKILLEKKQQLINIFLEILKP